MLSVMSCPMKLTVEGSSVKLKQLTVVVTAVHKSFCGPRSFFFFFFLAHYSNWLLFLNSK